MSSDAFFSEINVSRETRERLEIYAALLMKWNPAINLVAPSTIPDLWARHFLDSAQVEDLAPQNASNWCDIGTGGGFPGVVTAIMALETSPSRKTVCVESDVRKATFLRTVARETGANIEVLSDRIEKIAPQSADVLSARALASLTGLMGFAERHLSETGIALFLKGKNHQKEVVEAQKDWKFSLESYPSKTSPDAVILKIGDLKRA